MLGNFRQCHSDNRQIKSIEERDKKTEASNQNLICGKSAVIKYFGYAYCFTATLHQAPPLTKAVTASRTIYF